MPNLVYWAGTPPVRCDICHKALGATFFDARAQTGHWGCLCQTCYTVHGVGLGTGLGQKYEVQDDGRYLKVAG